MSEPRLEWSKATVRKGKLTVELDGALPHRPAGGSSGDPDHSGVDRKGIGGRGGELDAQMTDRFREFAQPAGE